MIATIILVLFRFYFVFDSLQASITKCVIQPDKNNDSVGEPKSRYGDCIDGIRHFFDEKGQKTSYTVTCETSFNRIFSQTSCVSKDSNGKSTVISMNSILIIIQILCNTIILSPFATIFTVLNAIIGFNGNLFNPPIIIIVSLGSLMFGDLLNSGIGYGFMKARGANGRFKAK